MAPTTSANWDPHHPKLNQKLNKPTSKPPIKPNTTTNHKLMLEITDPKSKRAYFLKFLTQNQITKSTKTQPCLPNHRNPTTPINSRDPQTTSLTSSSSPISPNHYPHWLPKSNCSSVRKSVMKRDRNQILAQ